MKQKNTKRRRMIWIALSIFLILALAFTAFLNQPDFGRLPQGERLERIRKSPHYREGQFWNLSPTRQLTSDKPKLQSLLEFVFRKVDRLRPETNLPVVKTDLKRLSRDKDLLVWFGHSSVFIQVEGKRILIDPVFMSAAPVAFLNKPFNGTDAYRPEDIPEIDYLVITHDHWDHLDYNTVMHLKERTGKIICGLGVGEYFEYWGFDKDRIIELDWFENTVLDNKFTFHCLPSRHFSGRGLTANKTLWVSFMLQTASKNIYISGDGGYDTHFAEIRRSFPKIDLAILENGQYNEDWREIHLMPQDLIKAVGDLEAARFLTVHNSKYALSKHAWDEPMENISQAAEKDTLNLITPEIGEVVYLNDTAQVFKKWWENID